MEAFLSLGGGYVTKLPELKQMDLIQKRFIFFFTKTWSSFFSLAVLLIDFLDFAHSERKIGITASGIDVYSKASGALYGLILIFHPPDECCCLNNTRASHPAVLLSPHPPTLSFSLSPKQQSVININGETAAKTAFYIDILSVQ